MVTISQWGSGVIPRLLSLELVRAESVKDNVGQLLNVHPLD